MWRNWWVKSVAAPSKKLTEIHCQLLRHRFRVLHSHLLGPLSTWSPAGKEDLGAGMREVFVSFRCSSGLLSRGRDAMAAAASVEEEVGKNSRAARIRAWLEEKLSDTLGLSCSPNPRVSCWSGDLRFLKLQRPPLDKCPWETCS